jgi:mRNA-degrading endonuclease RelE of RelBE toxin-antitoxin system
MTLVGVGGMRIQAMQPTERFERDYKKLTAEQQNLVDDKLKLLLVNPRPPGLRFEKLKGYQRPLIYTIHITGNYKLSFAIEGNTAVLRRIDTHDVIDRAP